MKVTIADYSGYCFGVKRAVTIVEDMTKVSKIEPVHTFGEIIHNNNVVERFIDDGISPISDITEAKLGDTVIIRAHGAADYVYDYARENGIKIIDATCPLVGKIHNIVARQSAIGKDILIFGNENHPEIIGIAGKCKNGNSVTIVNDASELETSDKKIAVVVQTTYDIIKWEQQEKIVKQKFKNADIFNTICSATSDRQQSAVKLANNSDLVLVVGDKKSSNTNKLYELCKEITNTLFIDNEDDLAISELDNKYSIGIIGGASTPDSLIEGVVAKIIGREENK